jgi:hypothetical protein
VGNSRGARKLARTLHVNQKKKKKKKTFLLLQMLGFRLVNILLGAQDID